MISAFMAGAIALAAVIAMRSDVTSAQSPQVSAGGTITSASGAKLEGVTVSAKKVGSIVTTSVFTDDQGDYVLPPLEAGTYQIWAQAQGYKAGRAEVQLGPTVKRQNFVLTTTPDFFNQLTGDQLLDAFVEETPDDVRMKKVFRNSCTSGCHSTSLALQNRLDAKGWESILNVMSKTHAYNLGEWRDDRPPTPVVNYYKKELAAYLAKNLGPGPSPMRFKQPGPRASGDSTLAVITEYDVREPARAADTVHDGSDWSRGTPAMFHFTHDAVLDGKGNLWFTHPGGADPDSGRVNTWRSYGKINTKTNEMIAFTVPGAGGAVELSHAITRDPEGIIWLDLGFTLGSAGEGGEGGGKGRLGRIDPETDKLEVFTPPDGMSGVGSWLEPDGKGGIWASTSTGSIRFDTKTRRFQDFPSKTQRTAEGHVTTYGTTGDADGNGWWSQMALGLVGKGNPKTGESEEFQVLPVADKEKWMSLFSSPGDREIYERAGAEMMTGKPWGQQPRRPGADLNGESVWVPMFFGGGLLEINIRTNAQKLHPPMPRLIGRGADAGPYDVKIDKDHMVWVAYVNSNSFAKYDPKTSRWTEYFLPSMGADLHQLSPITLNGRTEIATSYMGGPKVVRVQFRTRAEQRSLKAQVPRSSPAQAPGIAANASATAEVVEGHYLYNQRCRLCHTAGGPLKRMGPTLSKDRIIGREDAVRKMILEGDGAGMPAWKYALGPAQVELIIAYLKTVEKSEGTQAQAAERPIAPAPTARAGAAQATIAGGAATESVTQYSSSGTNIAAHLVKPTTPGKHAAVVIVHDNTGLTDYVKAITRRFAAAGFVALAPDLVSWAGGTRSESPRETVQALTKVPLLQTVADVRSAFEFLQKDPDVNGAQVSLVAFGWGGWRASKVAATVPQVHRVVLFSPVFPSEGMEQIKAPMLAQIGQYDFNAAGNAVAVAQVMGTRFKYQVYPSADRMFFSQIGSSDGPETPNLAAARQAWNEALKFLVSS